MSGGGSPTLALEAYRSLFYGLRIPMAVLDEGLVIIDGNEALSRMLTQQSGEVVGKPLSHFVYSSDQSRFTEVAANFTQDRTADHVFECQYLGAGDTRVFTRTVLSSSAEFSGYIAAALYDVTDLVEARTRAEILCSSSSVGIWDWLDVRFDREHWSPRFYELLGYENQEIPPTLDNFQGALHPDDQERTFELLQKHFKEGAVFDLEYRLKCKSGNYRWFRGIGQVERDREGQPTRMVGSIQDVHEQRVAHEQLQALAHNLEQANEALTRSNLDLQQFAYIASHDLQTPLRNISGFAHILHQGLKESLDKKKSDYFERIIRGCRSMQMLIQGMLNYSRVESRETPFVMVDLNETYLSAVEILSSSIAELNGEVGCTTKLPVVRGDPAQLLQLLQNLIGNALKYHGPESPQVTVSAELEDTGAWRLSVRDNGIGIAEGQLEKIFGLFTRLHCSDEYPGTGLGLAICRRIAERHGGAISAESVVGQGSVFHVLLPRANETSSRGSNDEDERTSSIVAKQNG